MYNGEINDSSHKNNKGMTRRKKEAEHWNKASKPPKRQNLSVSDSRRARGKSEISRYMSGALSEDDLYDER